MKRCTAARRSAACRPGAAGAFVTRAAAYLATPIMRLMGVTGAHVVNRLFGVVLGALAVQYVIDGLRGALLSPPG